MTALGADQIFLQNQNGQNKEEQEKLPFELGQEVKVKRSSGEVEKDWLVAGYDIAGKGWVRVEKGSLSKDIPQEKLVSWQEFFIPGEQVKVKRSSGEVENDWVVKAYDEEAQQVVVEKKILGGRLKKTVSSEALRSWQKSGKGTQEENISPEEQIKQIQEITDKIAKLKKRREAMIIWEEDFTVDDRLEIAEIDDQISGLEGDLKKILEMQ